MASIEKQHKDILSLVLRYGLGSLTIFFLVKMSRCKRLQRRFFSYFSTRFTVPKITAALHPVKEELFSSLKEMKSSDPSLSNQGPGVIRILEIGIGSGVNLQYYPKGCHLISVEPNPYFEEYFRKNSSLFPHITVESFIQGTAEDMSSVPSSSVDVVVSTHVLCSVSSIPSCLSEVSRVLSPGGRFLFLEHVSFPPDTYPFWARVQRLLQPFWSIASDGCRLTTDTREDIIHHHPPSLRSEKADVTLLLREKGMLFLRVMSPHVVGVSVKI